MRIIHSIVLTALYDKKHFFFLDGHIETLSGVVECQCAFETFFYEE